MPVSPERLWEALTDPDQVAGGSGLGSSGSSNPAAPARFHGDDGRDRAGRVEAVRPGRHLRFRWWPTDRRAGVSRTPRNWPGGTTPTSRR